MRASKERNTYGVRLFVESQNGGSCDWLLCIQHHPFLGDSFWSWRLCRACHWHLYKRVDQVIEFNRKALQTFLYFPEEQTNRRGAIYASVLFPFLDPWFHGCKNQKTPNSKTNLTRTCTHKHPSHRCLQQYSTSSPWAPLLLPWPASRLTLGQLFFTRRIPPAFSRMIEMGRTFPRVLWGIPG